MKGGFLVFGLLFTFSCSLNLPALPDMDVSSIASLNVRSSNRSVLISYSANAQEPGFSGYRFYLNDQYADTGLPFVVFNNPDLTLQSFQADPDNIQSLTLRTDASGMPLTNGKQYYVYATVVTSRTGSLVESEPSEILPVVPLTNFQLTLGNANRTGQTNDSIVFFLNGTVAPGDASSVPVAGTEDLSFRLCLEGGVWVPCLSVFSNQVYLQDSGSSTTLWSRRTVPYYPSGYLGPDDHIRLVDSHVYSVYDAGKDRYLKIRTQSVPSPQAFPDADVNVILQIMIQSIPGVNSF